MTALVDRPLSELLDALAARTPAPGGGCAAAWGCAIAAGLVEIAARFAAGDRMAGIATQAAALRGEAVNLADQVGNPGLGRAAGLALAAADARAQALP